MRATSINLSRFWQTEIKKIQFAKLCYLYNNYFRGRGYLVYLSNAHVSFFRRSFSPIFSGARYQKEGNFFQETVAKPCQKGDILSILVIDQSNSYVWEYTITDFYVLEYTITESAIVSREILEPGKKNYVGTRSYKQKTSTSSLGQYYYSTRETLPKIKLVA